MEISAFAVSFFIFFHTVESFICMQIHQNCVDSAAPLSLRRAAP